MARIVHHGSGALGYVDNFFPIALVMSLAHMLAHLNGSGLGSGLLNGRCRPGDVFTTR